MTEQQYLRSEATADSGQPTTNVWRNEVHARVSRFRTRRGRRIEGAFTMRFPFPALEPVATTEAVEVQAQSPEHEIMDEKADEVAATTETASTPVLTAELPQLTPQSVIAASEVSDDVAPPQPLAAQPEPPPVIQPRPTPKRKVIAFPRPTGTSEVVHRLADPVLPEQPRILDVPEELEAFPTTPFLDGLQFGPATQTPPGPTEHVDLPYRPVSISQRIYAALMDCSLVAIAVTVFALIGYKMLPNLVFTKPVRLTAALVPVLFWAIYQYVLLVYGGKTVGMQMAGIRLRTFKGAPPSLRHRRNRVLALYFSTASLVMGLLWALVDVDALCWHDRLSGTYLTKRE
jgi:uncharacterized RDD family membrane protein YckC